MARARNIKPGFATNEDLAECSIPARLCFALLPTLADREGRLEDRPKRIKGELFRFDSVEVEPMLGELAQRGFIERYVVDGRGLIQILAFGKHQNPHHREPQSILPPHPSLRLDVDGKWVQPEAYGGLHEPKALGKPEALTTSDDDKASIQPEALDPIPALSSCQNRVDSGALIPEQGFRSPDPGTRNAADPGEPGTSAGPGQVNPYPPSPTTATAVCLALRSRGIATVNPGHPKLLALVEAGATIPEFTGAIAAAAGKRDQFAYILGVVEGQRTDAAAMANGLHQGRLPNRQEALEDRNRSIAAAWAAKGSAP